MPVTPAEYFQAPADGRKFSAFSFFLSLGAAFFYLMNVFVNPVAIPCLLACLAMIFFSVRSGERLHIKSFEILIVFFLFTVRYLIMDLFMGRTFGLPEIVTDIFVYLSFITILILFLSGLRIIPLGDQICNYMAKALFFLGLISALCTFVFWMISPEYNYFSEITCSLADIMFWLSVACYYRYARRPDPCYQLGYENYPPQYDGQEYENGPDQYMDQGGQM